MRATHALCQDRSGHHDVADRFAAIADGHEQQVTDKLIWVYLKTPKIPNVANHNNNCLN